MHYKITYLIDPIIGAYHSMVIKNIFYNVGYRFLIHVFKVLQDYLCLTECFMASVHHVLNSL